jgi:aldose sugar dehydrogenase
MNPAKWRSRRRVVLLLCSLAVTGGCGFELPGDDSPVVASPAPRVAARALTIGRDSVPVALETVAAGLEVPWDFDFTPDGRILLTERPGRIRVIEGGVLRDTPWATLDVFASDPALLPESGLMGIAVSPDFETTGAVYVMATVWRSGGSPAARLYDRLSRRAAAALSLPLPSRWEARVYRFTDRGGRGSEPRLVIGGLPSSYYHAGGALRFGPDGMLYVTLGDAFPSAPDLSPEEASLTGTILRFTPDGGIPAGNPVPGSPVFAAGLRNSQGLAWHPEDGTLFAIDHGPSMLPHERGRAGNDELNLVRPGADFGWPVAAGDEGSGKGTAPVLVWNPGIAPGALAVYTDGAFPWAGDLLVGGLRGQRLSRLVLQPAGEGEWTVVAEDTLLAGTVGRIRAVRAGPDGAVYFTTSNRDGRGAPGPADDRLIRLRPDPLPACNLRR